MKIELMIGFLIGYALSLSSIWMYIRGQNIEGKFNAYVPAVGGLLLMLGSVVICFTYNGFDLSPIMEIVSRLHLVQLLLVSAPIAISMFIAAKGLYFELTRPPLEND